MIQAKRIRAAATSPTSRLLQAASETSLRINCGGPAFTDPGGFVWGADNNFTGGYVHSTSALVPNTNRQPIYQTERYGAASYLVPVTNGDYVVNLHFAEIYFGAVGLRVFGVNVQGIQAVIGLDIIQSTGANPLVLSVNRTVMNGLLSINLVPSVEQPKLSGIEVLSLAGSAPVPVPVAPVPTPVAPPVAPPLAPPVAPPRKQPHPTWLHNLLETPMLWQDGYYGSANRNRGRHDPRQVVWKSPLAPTEPGS
jgi:hypothetical protein